MNEQEKLPEWIYRFARNELHGKELEEFLALLNKDPQLRNELHLEKDLNEILAEKEIISLRKKIAKIKKSKEDRGTWLVIYLLAACAVVLLGLTVYYIYSWNELRKKIMVPVHEFSLTDTSFKHKMEEIKPNQMEIDKATIDSALARERRGDSSIRKRVRAMLATNYNPYPPFESLVGEITRSGFFKLLYPKTGESFKIGNEIAFSWDSDLSHNLTLEITNNKGLTVYRSAELTSKTLKVGSSKLIPGLYYFKFLENDEMVYFGKFSIH